MNKKTAILSGAFAILAVVASIGVAEMIRKPIQRMPEGREEYQMTDEELKQLETELKKLEAAEPTSPTETPTTAPEAEK